MQRQDHFHPFKKDAVNLRFLYINHATNHSQNLHGGTRRGILRLKQGNYRACKTEQSFELFRDHGRDCQSSLRSVAPGKLNP
jgi:hypothetical protein